MKNGGRTIVILLGGPGAGKGTQAQSLTRSLGIPHISTGQILRSEILRQTEAGNRAKAAIDAGGLVNDDLVNEVVVNRIAMPDCRTGFILDGYPRDLSQAVAFQPQVHATDRLIVIDIETDLEKVVERLRWRLYCKTCGTIYNTSTSPPKVHNTCDSCGGPLGKRSDDNEDVIRSRFAAYRRQTLPLADLYQELQVYHAVDGMRTSDEVARAIAVTIEGRGALRKA